MTKFKEYGRTYPAERNSHCNIVFYRESAVFCFLFFVLFCFCLVYYPKMSKNDFCLSDSNVVIIIMSFKSSNAHVAQVLALVF